MYVRISPRCPTLSSVEAVCTKGKLKLRLKIYIINKIPCFISLSLLIVLINFALNCEDHIVFVVGTQMCVKIW